MKTQNAITIAKYFLSIPDEESGDLISNLKLQKLLYYAQGYAVAINGKESPLFREKIYAWKHGPVVKSVYHHYSSHKSGALPLEEIPAALDDSNREFLDEIYRVFGKFSAWKLREMTHRESPWLENFVADKLDVVIPNSALFDYFSQHVEEN